MGGALNGVPSFCVRGGTYPANQSSDMVEDEGILLLFGAGLPENQT